jgi:hypothetical protein
MLQDALYIFIFYISIKLSWISNIRSSITIENQSDDDRNISMNWHVKRFGICSGDRREIETIKLFKMLIFFSVILHEVTQLGYIVNSCYYRYASLVQTFPVGFIMLELYYLVFSCNSEGRSDAGVWVELFDWWWDEICT